MVFPTGPPSFGGVCLLLAVGLVWFPAPQGLQVGDGVWDGWEFVVAGLLSPVAGRPDERGEHADGGRPDDRPGDEQACHPPPFFVSLCGHGRMISGAVRPVCGFVRLCAFL